MVMYSAEEYALDWYFKGTGKFKDYNNLKYIYAVNYDNEEERTDFYKQKCKLN